MIETISLDDKEREGIDHVTCQVCGARFKKITDSHLKTHNITIKEYRDRYPDAIPTCESTKQKESKSKIGKNNPMFGRRHTNEAKAKISKGNTGKIISDETRQRQSNSIREGLRTGRIIPLSGDKNPMFGKTGKNHPTFGIPLTEKHKKKLSESLRKGYRTGKRKTPKHGSWSNAGIRPDLKQWFRGTWEANIARILKLEGIYYVCEPQRFDLGKCTYLPDFYLPNKDLWIEVKGYIHEEKRERVAYQLKEFSKDHNLMVIDIPTYKQLEQKYKHLISNWETQRTTHIIRFTYRNVKKLFRKRKKL